MEELDGTHQTHFRALIFYVLSCRLPTNFIMVDKHLEVSHSSRSIWRLSTICSRSARQTGQRKLAFDDTYHVD